jgi:hypothetical protein
MTGSRKMTSLRKKPAVIRDGRLFFGAHELCDRIRTQRLADLMD